MGIFMIDTDSVSSSKSAIDNLAKSIKNIASEVSGYDTSCHEFDFNTPKKIIAGNLEACETKIQNTSSYINAVVSSHTNLQNSLKFDEKLEEAVEEMQEQLSGSGISSLGIGGYSGRGYGYSNSSYANYNNAPTVRQVNANISAIGYDKIDTNRLTDGAKKIVSKGVYNELGYATYGGMLLIACSSTIGNVGDIIEYTLKDGTKKRCMILENIEGEEVKFYVNDTWSENNPSNPTTNLKDNISIIENYGNYQASTGIVDLTNLPAIGAHTSKMSCLGDEWTVATTKLNVPTYANIVAAKGIAQNSNKARYSDYCLAFAQVHASNMYNGYSGDTAADAGRYKHADEFSNWYSNSKTDTLNKIYAEIVQGRPVILQVNGNKSGTSRHFITVVGFRNSITDPAQLTENDLLILDSYDGKLERMDQSTSRFMTTGSQTGKSYSGYYLRTLKV